MKIKWSQLKDATMDAFWAFCKNPELPRKALENRLYDQYRMLTIGAPPEGTESQAQFCALDKNWDRDARELSAPPPKIVPNLTPKQTKSIRKSVYEESYESETVSFKESSYFSRPIDEFISAPTPPVNFTLKLQFDRDGETAQERRAPPGKTIEAIIVDVAPNAPTVSRVNIVVRPECSGQTLYKKLRILNIMLTRWGCSSSGAICTWKVMSPKVSSTGPESAVIYLSEPINDGTVTHLTYLLCSMLRDELISLRTCPIGHVELARGIYGFDIPRAEDERRVFGISYNSSAGRFMSAVVSKAALDAAEYLDYGSAKKLSTLQGEDVSEYVRGVLDALLDDFGWELED